MSNTFVGVLKYNNFFKIWFSQIASQISLHMLNFAVILYIYETTNSTTSISLVMIASALPSVIFGPFSGVLADRVNYQTILTWTNFLRFLAVLLLFLARDNILAVLEIIFIISTITQFFAPAESSSIPLIIPKDKLVKANSAVMTTMYASLLIGYSIAGPILSLVSIEWLYLLCGLLYLLATYSTNSMTKYDHKTVPKIALSNWAHDLEEIWKETKNGLKHIRGKVNINEPMIKLAIGWMFLGAFIVLIPGFGENVLGISPKFIGPMIIAPAGFGMLLGAVFLDRKKAESFKKAINSSFLSVGLVMVVFSLYRFYDQVFFAKGLLIMSTIALGFFCSMVYISAQTLLHLNSSYEMRGRIFGISAMLINLAISIPALILGGIADITSPFFAMILLTFVTLIYGTSLAFEE